MSWSPLGWHAKEGKIEAAWGWKQTVTIHHRLAEEVGHEPWWPYLVWNVELEEGVYLHEYSHDGDTEGNVAFSTLRHAMALAEQYVRQRELAKRPRRNRLLARYTGWDFLSELWFIRRTRRYYESAPVRKFTELIEEDYLSRATAEL